jgi:hypothetical protein
MIISAASIEYNLETCSIALLRRQVAESFEAMLCSLDELGEALLDESALMAWVMDSNGLFNFPDHFSAREKIIQILNQYEYLSSQAPREIIVCAGFVGASQETLKIITKLNDQKDEFKQNILALKKIKPSLHEDELTNSFKALLSHKRNLPTASNLRKMGLGRLHLKQCYRKIPILNSAPLKISWTWANTRSIKRITVLEAEKLLRKRNISDEGIVLQLKKLSSLPLNEPLAIVQDLAPHLRANLVMAPSEPRERIMVKGPVPIFFPASLNQPWPQFKPPKKKTPKDKARVIRNDVRLDPMPFLPAIRAHRYL